MRTKSNSSPNASYGPGGDGAVIAYAIADSALGRLLVAGTPRGICFAAMGEADSTLVAELRRDYPRATIRVADPNRREDARVGRWANALAAYVAGRSKMPAPPMDIRGTPFQFAVWEQLRAIRPVRRAPLPRSRGVSDARAPSAPSAPPTAQIRCRLSSHVIAQFARRGISAVIDGDWIGSVSYWRWSLRNLTPFSRWEGVRG